QLHIKCGFSGRRYPPASARFRPSPATCGASTPRSEDRRSTDATGLRQFPLPRPGAVARAPQGALVWTCWGALLRHIVTCPRKCTSFCPIFEVGSACAAQQSPICLVFQSAGLKAGGRKGILFLEVLG